MDEKYDVKICYSWLVSRGWIYFARSAGFLERCRNFPLLFMDIKYTYLIYICIYLFKTLKVLVLNVYIYLPFGKFIFTMTLLVFCSVVESYTVYTLRVALLNFDPNIYIFRS